MTWVILLLSAVAEAVWATALGTSDGFTNPVAIIVFLVFMALSMIGLAYATKQIPIGTAYAVWSGVGAGLTVVWSMVTGQQEVTFWPIVFLTGIIAAVVGLRLVPSRKAAHGAGAQGKQPPSATRSNE